MKHVNNTTSLNFTLSAMLLTAGLTKAECQKNETGKKERDQPNIVLLLTDDHPWYAYGFMGDTIAETPNIDELAAQSLRFTNGYVPVSVCRPSLGCLITGLYPHQSGICFNRIPGHHPDTEKHPNQKHIDNGAHLIKKLETLPDLLKREGYVSLQTGKHWEGDYKDAGFDEGTTHYLPNGARNSYNGTYKENMIGRETLDPIYDFVNRQVKENNPFFVWYGVYLPHAPTNAPEKFNEIYKNKGLEHFEVKYYANISWLDESIGQIMDFFEKKGLMENTLFILVSDNGMTVHPNPWWGGPHGKSSVWEMGLRSPILVSWKNKVKPRTCDVPVSSIDIVPTFLEAAGVKYDDTPLPGKSFLPFDGCEKLKSRPVFGEIYNPDPVVDDIPERTVSYRYVIHGDYKLISPENLDRREDLHEGWPSKANRPRDHFEEVRLFNIRRDPHELVNLAEVEEYKNKRDELILLLNEWWPLGNE